jgi:protein-L-isoaspartate(D-aspartate) O-methyltransferase
MDLQQALKQVNYDYFARTEDGNLFPQSTRSDAVADGIQLLNVQPGHHVLEIGTGSGYSTALLATLVGETGKVTSVDIDLSLSRRAQDKLSHFSWVECITGDGREGYQPNAPYDRIIAWATPERLPTSWKHQIKEQGILVTPFPILPFAGCIVTVQLVHERDGVFKGQRVIGYRYILMTSDPALNTVGMEIQADFVIGSDVFEEEPAWVNSDWLKQTRSLNWAEKFLHQKPDQLPFSGTGKNLRPYLYVNNPKGFTTAFHPEHGFWIGYSTPQGFALLSDHSCGQCLFSDKEHADVLQSWFDQWRILGKPTYDDLLPVVVGDQIKLVFKDDIRNADQ